MVSEVSQDDGKGGLGDNQNREFGGKLATNDIVASTPGNVGNLKEGETAEITLPIGVPTFHSHPSGTYTRPDGVKKIYYQSPSESDIKAAGSHIHYVFGRRDGKTYIYNSQGVLGVIPTKNFLKPKK